MTNAERNLLNRLAYDLTDAVKQLDNLRASTLDAPLYMLCGLISDRIAPVGAILTSTLTVPLNTEDE